MSQNRCTLKVRGLDCPVEMQQLRSALEGSPGVLGLGFDLIMGTLTIDHDPELTHQNALIRRIREQTGMEASPLVEGGSSGKPEAETNWREGLRRWGPTVSSGALLLAGIAVPRLGGSWRLAAGLFVLAVAAGGFELFPKAVRGLRLARLDIHVLMSLAVAGAAILGQWDEAATVVFLFGLSEALEGLSLARAKRAVRALLEVSPETAEVIGGGGEPEMVPADQVRAGQRVLVRAGDRVPVDGVILVGSSSVDQQMITGESVPVERGPGDEVFAGTVNGEGTLEIEASGPLGDALISRVIARVREAQAGKAPVERRIARFAAWYTPIVVAAAVAVMLGPPLLALASRGEPAWLDWFSRGLVVLVISCPCALVIATPVAVVSAMASAARRGVLVKGGQYLEEIGRIRSLALDKTGTLTRGAPNVVEVVSEAGRDDDDVLRIAAALGDRGNHVLGRAIARHARERRIDVPSAGGYLAVPGRGAKGEVAGEQIHIGSHRYLDESGMCQPDFHDRLGLAEATVGTSVALSAESGPIGWIRLADQARPEAFQVLQELNALGVRAVMLTGDHLLAASAMAEELGLAEFRSGLLPAEKVAAVAELDARHGPAGMMGDGVNDAPALAAARVSVALGGVSSGAALESADIVLMSDDLRALPWVIRHGRRMLRLIRENIVLALLTKAIVLVLAAMGYANLWMAIGADVGASLLVTLNALRLLRA